MDAHKVLSWLGSIIGVPFLTAGMLKRNRHSDLALIFTMVPLGFLFLYKILPRDVKSLGNAGLSIVSVLTMIVSCVLVNNSYGILTAVSIVTAAAVGADGKILSMPRVDVFHYVLAFSNLFYLHAIN